MLNRSQLTSILLYLKTAFSYTEAAHDIAGQGDDAETGQRLEQLMDHITGEIVHAEESRAALQNQAG